MFFNNYSGESLILIACNILQQFILNIVSILNTVSWNIFPQNVIQNEPPFHFSLSYWVSTSGESFANDHGWTVRWVDHYNSYSWVWNFNCTRNSNFLNYIWNPQARIKIISDSWKGIFKAVGQKHRQESICGCLLEWADKSETFIGCQNRKIKREGSKSHLSRKSKKWWGEKPSQTGHNS